MSEKLDGVNVSYGISGDAMGESNEGVSGVMVGGSESKTLVENSSDKGVLSDRVRVTEESAVLVGSNLETVNSGSGWKIDDTGSLEINEKHDASKSRVVEMKSRNNGWESWGVMDLVGRVLNGKFSMDEEMEDVNNFEKRPEVNLVQDMDTRQGVIGEPTSSNEIDFKGPAINKDSEKLDLGRPVEKFVGLHGNQDLVSHELVPGGKLEIEEVKDVKADVLIPKEHEEHYIAEKEVEYYVSDLVWGKVRSHPWWPGQIFAPSDASDKARKYFKKESYLVAYFGDQTFAWNEGSKLKPFWTHFSQMEKQSNADGFCHAVDCALDEVARRVELGLSCPCLLQETHDKIKYQDVANAGIQEESSRRAGGDNLSSAASFLPGEFVQFLGSLAESPQSKTDRLQFVIRKAQLLAFNRWKGQYQLPVLEECGELLEDDTQFTVNGEGKDLFEAMEGLLPGPDSEGANDFPPRKRRSTAQNGSSWKRKHQSGNGECPKMKEKCILMSSSCSSLQNDEKKPVRRSGRKAISSGKNRETVNSIVIPADIPAPDVILSKLMLAANKPTQGHDVMISVVGLLREFRNSFCLEKSRSENAEEDQGKQPSNLEATDTFGFEGANDSYWTDRIIQGYSQDPVLFQRGTPCERAAESDASEDAVIVNLNTENPSLQLNELTGEYCPTALTLNFSNLESIPSITNLNEIFSRYGPLDESETKILSKSKRAKVIFLRRADAETAFSSAGKYNIFGPSLVSYRLNYAPKPHQSRATSKPSNKTHI